MSNPAVTEAERHPRGPVIVLSYPHAGTEVLTEVLSANPSLACTSGTGLLAVCHAAAATWQVIEAPQPRLSAVAVKSIRALATTMITTVQAAAGGVRWCETAFVMPEAATTFLNIFPETTFLCLHRPLKGVIADGMAAHPWGLGGSPFWPHPGPHPGDNVTAIATFWVARTEALLDFEARHAHRAMRVRYDELVADRAAVTKAVYQFLGLNGQAPSLPHRPTTSSDKTDKDLADWMGRLPEALRVKVDDLHGRLGYRSEPDDT
jgi:protein-tyrosine sulfotransferase